MKISLKIKFVPFCKEIYNNEGIRGLYRGFSFALILGSFSNYLFFYQLNMLNCLTNNIYDDFNSKNNYSISKQISNSYLAGLISALISHPLWTIRLRISQISFSKTENFKKGNKLVLLLMKDLVSSKQKVFSLFRGIIPTFFLSFYPAIQMTIYQQIKNNSKKENFIKYGSLYAGSLSQFTTSLIVYPLNLIKSKQQQLSQVKNSELNKCLYGNDLNEKKFIKFHSAVKHIYNEYGIRGFYSGSTPLIIRNIIKGGIFFNIYENINHLMRSS